MRSVPSLWGLSALLAFLALVPALAAQNGSAVILDTQGDSFNVVRDGREVLPLELPLGFAVLPGDIVKTGKDSLVELAVYPQRSLLKVAGNTTFRYLGRDEAGQTSIELIYGRLRVKSAAPGQGQGYRVFSGDCSVAALGGDFAMESLVPRDSQAGQAEVLVYCMEGAAELSQSGAPVKLSPGALYKTGQGPDGPSVQRMELDPERLAFWLERDFRSPEAALFALAAPGPDSGSRMQEDLMAKVDARESAVVAKPQKEKAKTGLTIDIGLENSKLRAKNGLLAVGSSLALGGLGLQGICAYRYIVEGSTEDAASYMTIGLLCSGAGFLIDIVGILLNPRVRP